MRQLTKFGVSYAGMPFDMFVKAIAVIPDEIADGHFASQHPRLTVNGDIIIDLPGRFEVFQNEVGKYQRKVGIDHEIMIPHINGSLNKGPYQAYYTDKVIEAVERRYKKDIELIGYTFEES